MYDSVPTVSNYVNCPGVRQNRLRYTDSLNTGYTVIFTRKYRCYRYIIFSKERTLKLLLYGIMCLLEVTFRYIE